MAAPCCASGTVQSACHVLSDVEGSRHKRATLQLRVDMKLSNLGEGSKGMLVPFNARALGGSQILQQPATDR